MAKTCWALLGMLLLGCNSQDADRLARVSRKAVTRACSITSGEEKLSGGLDMFRSSLDDVTIDARILARLRWDKALQNVSLQVHAKEGTVELRGKVRDLAQRRKAVDLAESTAGVEKVVDLLEVPARDP